MNKNINGFVIIDSLIAILLIASGILFYIECDRIMDKNMKNNENILIESRNKYEDSFK